MKNEVQFYYGLENPDGVSILTFGIEFVTQVVVLAYLVDNSSTASVLILLECVGNMVLPLWKIYHLSQFKLTRTFPFLSVDYNEVYKRSNTQKYDRQAIKAMSVALLPLFASYVAYSFLYEHHKGLFSFGLKSLVTFVYLFQFITMTPQLYINYKLQSVEHMPGKALFYRFLNTIIDDLFAFIIAMPSLYRINCFKDDIIFIIYVV